MGVEGTGFEPTIDALFGENGFFPDSISKVLYWVKDQAGLLRGILQKISPDTERFKKQVKFCFQQTYAPPNKPSTFYTVWAAQYSGWFTFQVPQDLLDDIKAGARRLVDEIRFSPAPEATAYLRFLGTEIGYMKTSDMRKMAETLFMYYHVFFRILPSQVSSANKASQRTDNTVLFDILLSFYFVLFLGL